MKKIMLFGAMALVGIMSSCSSDEVVTSPDNGENGLQEIKLGFGIETTATTRGTGTVGGFEGSNEWNGQKFNVFMLDKGTVRTTHFYKEGANFDNAVFIAEQEKVRPEDGRKRYYPAQGIFDFWGYRLDGCNTGETKADADSTMLMIPFKMDGSQDILVGKATPSPEEINSCPQPERIYSAYAARRDIQPCIKFEHLLSRLEFSVMPATTADIKNLQGLSVTGIEVVSKSTGKLIVAYTGNVTDRIVFDDTEERLALKQRAADGDTNKDLIPLKPVTPLWYTEVNAPIETPVGDALLVAPADSYKIIVHLSQLKNDSYDENNTNMNPREFSYEDNLSTSGGFKAGYSYKVNISVYGLCEIELATTLKAWENGGNIPLNPEENGTITQ